MSRSIQSMAAQARREALSAGLPCGEHTYTNKCENQEAYRAIEAMRSPEQIAERRAKEEAEKAARMLAAKTLTPAELDLAIKVIDEVRKDLFWNTKSDVHWELIPILSKLRRMQND